MGLLDPFTTATKLTDCICPVLKSEDREEDAWTGHCCVWPGNSSSLASCCESGGSLSVNVVNGWPTTTFPNQEARPWKCNMLSWATVYEIKVNRCVGFTTDDCDCECKERGAYRVLGDLRAVLQGIVCCFSADDDIDTCAQYVINGWQILPAEGGCSGVQVTVTVETDPICCPPPLPPEENDNG